MSFNNKIPREQWKKDIKIEMASKETQKRKIRVPDGTRIFFRVSFDAISMLNNKIVCQNPQRNILNIFKTIMMHPATMLLLLIEN